MHKPICLFWIAEIPIWKQVLGIIQAALTQGNCVLHAFWGMALKRSPGKFRTKGLLADFSVVLDPHLHAQHLLLSSCLSRHDTGGRQAVALSGNLLSPHRRTLHPRQGEDTFSALAYAIVKRMLSFPACVMFSLDCQSHGWDGLERTLLWMSVYIHKCIYI